MSGPTIIQIHGEIEPVRTDRHQPTVVVAEIDPIASPDNTTKLRATKGCSLASSSAVQLPAIDFDTARSWIEPTNPVCLRVGDIHDIVRIERDGGRPREFTSSAGPSPLKPCSPVPTTVVMPVSRSILRIRLLP